MNRRRRTSDGVAVLAAFALASCDRDAVEPASAETRPVVWLSTGAPVAASSARLLRYPDRLEAVFQTGGLTPGHAVTLLWAVFNQPEACQVGNAVTRTFCGPPDLGNAATGATVQIALGRVVGSDGTLSVADSLRLRETSRCTTPVPCRDGLTNPLGGEVHLVVRDHGPALRQQLDAQLGSFNGGCPPNTCANPVGAQFVPAGLPSR